MLDFDAKRPHVYSPLRQIIGQVFASHAAVALNRQLADTPETAGEGPDHAASTAARP